MIITKTPLRVSFLGGGTDYPDYFKDHGGSVLATSIDKYCYVTLTTMSDFFEHTIRLSYSKQELVRTADEIKHPVVREVLKLMGVPSHIEINCIADLPARTGLGSSSAFVVCLIQALASYKGRYISKEDIATLAIQVEQDILQENVGSQDQVVTAQGGLQQVVFSGKNRFSTRPLPISEDRKRALEGQLMMFYTGIQRFASEVAQEQVKRTSVNIPQLNALKDLVGEGVKILEANSDIREFGKLLHEGWMLKKSFAKAISNNMIDEMYQAALKAGALGGKLLGAGGGGFILLQVPIEKQQSVRQALHKHREIPFRFDEDGTQVIYYKHQPVL